MVIVPGGCSYAVIVQIKKQHINPIMTLVVLNIVVTPGLRYKGLKLVVE